MSKAADSLSKLAATLRPLMNFVEDASATTFTIGQLSSHLGVSLRTLRFYEQSGLLQPARSGARRIYSTEDRDRLEVIVALREFEVSLTGVKALMTVADAGGPNIEERIRAQFDLLLGDVLTSNKTRIAELEGINDRIARAREADAR